MFYSHQRGNELENWRQIPWNRWWWELVALPSSEQLSSQLRGWNRWPRQWWLVLLRDLKAIERREEDKYRLLNLIIYQILIYRALFKFALGEILWLLSSTIERKHEKTFLFCYIITLRKDGKVESHKTLVDLVFECVWHRSWANNLLFDLDFYE